MTAPQTDAPTLQDILRGPRWDHLGFYAEAARQAADALDARDATIAALVEVLEDCVPPLFAVAAGDTGYTVGWSKEAHDKALAALAKARTP